MVENQKSLGNPQPDQDEQRAVRIGEENVPDDESEDIRRLADLEAQIHQAVGNSRRGQHPKGHGAVWARFQILAGLDEQLRVGIFRPSRDYTAVIRFSNGKEEDDTNKDVHGMAIKVFVPGESDPEKIVIQDFVLADIAVFFAGNVKDLFEFSMTMASAPAPQRAETAFKLASTPKYKNLAHFRQKPPASPLEAKYWSQTPYRWGISAVKYHILPSPENAVPTLPQKKKSSKNFLREAMAERLTFQKRPASFDFCIQLQTDPGTMPIEDPTIAWTSDFIKVATITIYPQTFDSARQLKFCEDMSFNPWHGLPEHCPLGGINRARRSIYEASCSLRNQTNNVIVKELTGRERF